MKDTHIVYWLSCDADVRIKIYTVSGEVVRWEEYISGHAGYNDYYWDGKNRAVHPVASGIFIYRISASTPRDREQFIFSKCACLK
jgi:flagellar hook assembly protein FlgD